MAKRAYHNIAAWKPNLPTEVARRNPANLAPFFSGYKGLRGVASATPYAPLLRGTANLGNGGSYEEAKEPIGHLLRLALGAAQPRQVS